jgi:hypothetical protein
MPPTWLVVVAWCALAIAFASIITFDIFVRRNRQPMRVMEAVWPITALYLAFEVGLFGWMAIMD